MSARIIVRAFAPCVTLGEVPRELSLAQWDVRPWCNSSVMFERFLRAFAHCDVVRDRPIVKVSMQVLDPPHTRRHNIGARRPLALPAPSRDVADGVSEVAIDRLTTDPVDVALQRLADTMSSGAGPYKDGGLYAADFDDLGEDLMDTSFDRLTDIGAVRAYLDDDGHVLYRIEPAGIQWAIETHVDGLVNDMDSLVSHDSKLLIVMTKLELLLKILDKGTVAVPTLKGRSQGI